MQGINCLGTLGQTEWCYPNGTVNNGQLQCPPVRYACARGEIDMLSPTDDPIPPSCELFIYILSSLHDIANYFVACTRS